MLCLRCSHACDGYCGYMLEDVWNLDFCPGYCYHGDTRPEC